jgi:hypothetical protein
MANTYLIFKNNVGVEMFSFLKSVELTDAVIPSEPQFKAGVIIDFWTEFY